MPEYDLPMPWTVTLGAMIPGLLATLGLTNIDFSAGMFTGLGLLTLYLGVAYVRNHNHLPAWGLMAAGFLVGISLTITLGVLAGLLALIFGKNAAELLVLVGLGVAFTAVWASLIRGQTVSPRIWFLLALIVVCQLAVRLKYFVLFGLSWSVAGQWLGLSFYAVLSSLLLPLALGLRWARRHGQLAMLFIVGTTYIGFQLLTDIGHTVSLQLGDTPLLALYKTLIPLLFTVVAPLWFVRAPAARPRMVGLVTIIGLAIIFDLLIVLAYGPYPPLIWISAVPYTSSVLLTLVLGKQLCSLPIRA